jgi:hypothetical protein
MNTGKSENDEKLLYGIEPDTVYTTEEATDPFPNTLTLHIANPKTASPRTCVNLQALTPEDNLPGIDEVGVEYHLSRFYIWSPWGGKEGDLCTQKQAGDITVSPGPHNDSWYVVQQSDSKVGTYWILFPKKETVLDPEESVTFVLDNIITTTAVGMSYMYIKNRQIKDYEDATQVQKISKEVHEVEIRSFYFDPGTIAMGGESTLKWETLGATSCVLNPGDEEVERIGQKKASTDKDAVYTLRAQCGSKSTDKDARLYVGTVRIDSFECTPGEVEKEGTKVELRWKTKYASSCKIGPDIGQVDTSGSIEVIPEAPTEYTLTCDGKGGPVARSVKVETMWVRILKLTTHIDWRWGPGRTGVPSAHTYVDWETDKATACELCRVPSQVLSTATKGSIEVPAYQAATYRLTCEGLGGPISGEVTYSGDPGPWT